MEATLLLADSAQTDAAGKVHALGLGWSVTSTPGPPFALVVLIRVPWTATNQRHQLTLTLLDADGQPFPGSADGSPTDPVRIEGEFEAGRPPGIPPGMSIDQSLSVNVSPGLPFVAGETYEWRMTIDGQTEPGWSARFWAQSDG